LKINTGNAMGGIKKHLEAFADQSNLPMEAYTGSYECIDIADSWISKADQQHQKSAMKLWFEERYVDPVCGTGISLTDPYADGGPFSPVLIVSQRFSGYVSNEVIESVVDELLFAGGERWAPRKFRTSGTYNEDFAISVAARTAPLQKTLERINDVRAILTLPADANGIALVRKLAYSAAITALESFLWETMVFWVENEDFVVHNIITKHPAFKDQPIKLGSIFDKTSQLKRDILGYMQGVVWHNWDKVGPLYSYGLGLKKLNFDLFSDAVLKRHDIVHRSGLTKQGESVSISIDEITRLCQQIARFALSVSNQLESLLDDDIPF
jgi:hypothetical protein